MRVSQQEQHLKAGHTCLGEEGLNVSLQVSEAVVRGDDNPEYLLVQDETGQLGQTLFTRATDTDEERITARLEQNSSDSGDMFHSLVEENEVHGTHSLVIFGKLMFKDSSKVLHLLNRLVSWLVTLAHRDERSVNQRFSEDNLFLEFYELLETVSHEVHVGGDILWEEESIEPDSVALVSPHAHDSRWVTLVGGGLSQHDVLHNLGNISHVELIMELDGSGGELGRKGDTREDINGSLYDLGCNIDALLIEGLEVFHEHLGIDCRKDVLFGSTKHNLGEMTRGSQVDVEGTGLGVHAGGEHDVLEDVLFLEMLSVEDDLVVDNLSDQTQRRLSAVSVDGGHVEIVHEEDHVATGGGSENLTGTLVDVSLNYLLECLGVGVRVEVHGGVHALLGVKGVEVVLEDCGLASTGGTDVKETLFNRFVNIEQKVLSCSFNSGHDNVLEETIKVGIEGCNLLSPGLELKGCGAEVVVEDHTTFREFDLAHGAHLTVEGNSVFGKSGTEGPHEGESEETFIDNLLLLSPSVSIFFKTLDNFLVLLSLEELLVLVINDASKRLEGTHIASRGNLLTMFEVVQVVLITVLSKEESEGGDGNIILLLDLVLG